MRMFWNTTMLCFFEILKLKNPKNTCNALSSGFEHIWCREFITIASHRDIGGGGGLKPRTLLLPGPPNLSSPGRSPASPSLLTTAVDGVVWEESPFFGVFFYEEEPCSLGGGAACAIPWSVCWPETSFQCQGWWVAVCWPHGGSVTPCPTLIGRGARAFGEG